VDDTLHPGRVGFAGGRAAADPALVVIQQLAAPVAVVEGWAKRIYTAMRRHYFTLSEISAAEEYAFWHKKSLQCRK
jgi:hypothetical protein